MRVGIGISDKQTASEAGWEAADQAVQTSGPPTLAILLTTDHYDQAAVLASAQSRLGRTKLVGACSAGLFSGDKILNQGVGILTLAGEELQASTALVRYGENEARDAGIFMGEKLLGESQDHGAILCFPDGFAGNISRMLDGIYDAAGPGFAYAGGGTGDNLRFSRTWQITDKGIISNGVAGAYLGGCTVTTQIGHEWEPTGPPLVITHGKGKVVYELDGRSAFEVYSERFGGIEPDNFPHVAMRFPFGISYGTDSYLVRDPVRIVENTAIEFVTEIPKRAVAYIMKPREAHSLSMAETLGRKSFQSLENPCFALVSYCVSRSLLLGPKYEQEIQALLRPFPDGFPILGFLAFGEISGHVNGPQLHNKSISLMVGGA